MLADLLDASADRELVVARSDNQIGPSDGSLFTDLVVVNQSDHRVSASAMEGLKEDRRSWRGLLLTMLLVVLVSPGTGQDSERRDIEGKLLALERAGKLKATQLKDLKMLNEVLDENFVLVDQDAAVMNKAQVLRLCTNGNIPSISDR